MKTNNKCAAVRLEKSKLVAALAILAVAFVVIAAVPAVVDDSDATDVQITSVKDLTELKTALNEDKPYIKLTNDITVTVNQTSDRLVIKSETVLDLNGKTISLASTATGDLQKQII